MRFAQILILDYRHLLSPYIQVNVHFKTHTLQCNKLNRTLQRHFEIYRHLFVFDWQTNCTKFAVNVTRDWLSNGGPAWVRCTVNSFYTCRPNGHDHRKANVFHKPSSKRISSFTGNCLHLCFPEMCDHTLTYILQTLTSEHVTRSMP